MTNRMLTPNAQSDGSYELGVKVDTYDTEYIVRAQVPNMRPEDLHIEVADNVVTVRGQFQEDRREEGDMVVVERHVAQFSRSVTLPDPVDPYKAEAVVENGVLTLRLPRTTTVQPKAIAVKSKFG
jgi:HSP20 family protein